MTCLMSRVVLIVVYVHHTSYCYHCVRNRGPCPRYYQLQDFCNLHFSLKRLALIFSKPRIFFDLVMRPTAAPVIRILLSRLISFSIMKLVAGAHFRQRQAYSLFEMHFSAVPVVNVS